MAELDHPPLPADLALVREYFERPAPRRELRNPHVEPRVSPQVRRRARDAAVLIPLVDDEEPRILVTRRHHRIRFAGHVCFPGGTRDPEDASPVQTALRETEEEINLGPDEVVVLGCLGDYYTQAGYRITPVVGVVSCAARYQANPQEVDDIYEVSLGRALDASSYRISWRGRDRGHFAFHEGDVRIAGPTVSLMIGFYEELLRHCGRID